MTALVRGAGTCLALAALGSGCGADDAPGDTVRIGVLLPYTGEASAISANLERGALLAVDEMNQAGGVGERPVQLVFGNTFSDSTRSRRAVEELVNAGVMAVIGPGGDEVSGSVREALNESGVALISPIASTRSALESDAQSPWFRLSPTTQVIGQNLAKLVGDAGVARVALVASGDDYHQELGESFSERFQSYGRLESSVTLNEGQGVAAIAVDLVAQLDSGLEGIVLLVHPRVAARVATEVAALRTGRAPPKWFLSPRLKTELVLQNASPGALEGAVGIGPEVFDTTRSAFEARFSRGTGDLPFDSTFFVYDATAVTLIAMDRAATTDRPLPESLPQAIEEVASFGGRLVRWNEFDQARRVNGEAGAMQFTGLTGPVILAEDGSRITGTSSSWGVEDGVIVDH